MIKHNMIYDTLYIDQVYNIVTGVTRGTSAASVIYGSNDEMI